MPPRANAFQHGNLITGGSPDEAPTRVSHGAARMRQWGGVVLLALGMASYNAIGDWRDSHAFMINASDSLPNWAFFVRHGKSPGRGQYVFFVPPDNALVRRHFGRESGPFGKRLLGMPGDMVSHAGTVVLVNGVPVARMKYRSRFGEALTPGPVGRVPDGCYYVGTPHPDGFDSRYAEIGFACRKQLLGTGTPIL